MPKNVIWRQGTRHVALIVISLVMFFPFLWMILSALKTNQEIMQFPPTLFPAHPQWHNFSDAWHAAPFGRYMFNSVFTAGIIVACQVLNSAMMGYAISHMRFWYKNAMQLLILASYMLPVAATYLPSYIILSKMHLLNSYVGLIISNSASVFSIYLVRQTFLQIPREIVEAARIDGSSHWRVLFRILVPLSMPTFVVLALLAFISNYNNYLWPLIITNNPNLELVAQGLQSFFVQAGGYGMNWSLIMAASSFTILPLLILFAVMQKWIMKGVNAFDVNIG